MYKVMVVDDEMLVRIGIRSIMDWNEAGFEIIAEASNGEAAYEKYLALKPHVVITDIKMPKKDGIWLTGKIKENNPDTEVIILTCYDDFHYAREALKYKVSNYILKVEMEQQEICDIMKNIRENLDKKSNYIQSEHENKEINKRKQQEYLLALLLDERKSIDTIHDHFTKNQLQWNAHRYCLIQFDFKTSLNDRTYTKENITNIISACMELVWNKFNDKNYICFAKPFGKTITLFLMAGELGEMQLKNEIVSLKKSLKQYLNIEVKSASTPIMNSIEQMRAQVEWLFRAADLLFYVEKGGHLDYEERKQKQEQKYSHDLVKEIGRDIEKNDENSICERLQGMKKEFLNAKTSSFDMKYLMAQFISDMNKYFENYLGKRAENLKIQQEIMQVEDFFEMMEIVETYLCSMRNSFLDYGADNSHFLIEKAVHYIEDNYKDKLLLEDVAGYVGISKYYFSYLFKKEKAINFTSYINKVRIDKAIDLLKNPQITVNQIYEEVGFNDQQYFSKTFKKYTGMTVTEYRAR